MATIRREVSLNVPAANAWDALRDVGALHTRLCPGFVTDVKVETDANQKITARQVTFGNGMTARELIVTVDDAEKRLVWSVVGGRMTHHNASAQVFDAGPARCRFVWVADLLPDELEPAIAKMIEAGLAAVSRTLKGDRGGG